ncbi:uncharacterized protein MAM_05230 [Metarhizium album ARSEF 1941]|uniref:Uncharacterized protein n=1 Tax=Metarhizium album (strain ARSEF 1941) TaxID=1081103 RepID=A0A0B2WM40_METAS|nr:uncharacterized protein MAM_05230 [Metarhizium album ARSEF 1941]KHN97121.1 hypothetical protein MAM_05230 [Metarhizium album ARSEF 1941]
MLLKSLALLLGAAAAIQAQKCPSPGEIEASGKSLINVVDFRWVIRGEIGRATLHPTGQRFDQFQTRFEELVKVVRKSSFIVVLLDGPVGSLKEMAMAAALRAVVIKSTATRRDESPELDGLAVEVVYEHRPVLFLTKPELPDVKLSNLIWDMRDRASKLKTRQNAIYVKSAPEAGIHNFKIRERAELGNRMIAIGDWSLNSGESPVQLARFVTNERFIVVVFDTNAPEVVTRLRSRGIKVYEIKTTDEVDDELVVKIQQILLLSGAEYRVLILCGSQASEEVAGPLLAMLWIVYSKGIDPSRKITTEELARFFVTRLPTKYAKQQLGRFLKRVKEMYSTGTGASGNRPRPHPTPQNNSGNPSGTVEKLKAKFDVKDLPEAAELDVTITGEGAYDGMSHGDYDYIVYFAPSQHALVAKDGEMGLKHVYLELQSPLEYWTANAIQTIGHVLGAGKRVLVMAKKNDEARLLAFMLADVFLSIESPPRQLGLEDATGVGDSLGILDRFHQLTSGPNSFEKRAQEVGLSDLKPISVDEFGFLTRLISATPRDHTNRQGVRFLKENGFFVVQLGPLAWPVCAGPGPGHGHGGDEMADLGLAFADFELELPLEDKQRELLRNVVARLNPATDDDKVQGVAVLSNGDDQQLAAFKVLVIAQHRMQCCNKVVTDDEAEQWGMTDEYLPLLYDLQSDFRWRMNQAARNAAKSVFVT